MSKLHDNDWNLRGWYVAPTTFVSIHAAALIFYILGAIVNFQTQATMPSQADNAAGSAEEVMGLILFSVCFLFAPWRRWVYSGKHKTNYITWTCVQGVFAIVFGLAVGYKMVSGNSSYVILISGVSFLLWLTHTIMIPSPDKDRRRAHDLNYLKRWN